MEILAFGVQADEKPLMEKAFAGRHEVRCLDVFLSEDTAPIAAGYEIVSSSVNADLGGRVLRILADGGTRMIAQRSTGFNALVDTDALVDELRAGRFAGVGLDVYEAEAGLFFTDRSLEAVEDDTLARLITFPNVVVTSHQAYYTHDAVGQIVDATLANVQDYLAGRRSGNTLSP
ncbi:NAD(P)-dependent oxidoreductase [Streptomyces sp. NPDC060333]|uniref:NAD(P)-dependent oxidoreductase n=1 Tax=Streptomyces sp. NPDC060333 TaxID=3347098 RepID=UPI0036626A28